MLYDLENIMCHVLIIEDDWLLSDHIAQLIETAGATSVDIAGTEDEAVTVALDHPPAIIISDVNLPQGTGPLAVQRILATLGTIPVLFVTGSPDVCEPRSDAMRMLVKPVDDRLLVSTFQTIAPAC